MIALYRKKNSSSERGVALVMALLVLLLLTAVGMGMILMSNTESNISANFRDEQTAYFASKAGVEEVRDRLRAGAVNSLSTNILLTAFPPPMAGAAGGVLYVTNPASGETVAPWNTTGFHYPDDEICKELTSSCVGGVPLPGWYITTPASASPTYAASPILPWKWVRVMAKINKSDTGATRVTSVDGTTNGNRVCWNGFNEVAIASTFPNCAAANPSFKSVYELTSLAVTPGGSRRMMQYELSQNSFPTIPGAFVFDGSNPSFNPPNSSAFIVSGTDTSHSGTGTGPYGSINGVSCSTPTNQPALGSFDNPATSTLTAAVQGPPPPDRSSQYPSGSSPTPAIANIYTALSSNPVNLTTVDGLTNLVKEITTAAGPNVYPNGTVPTLMGTTTSPVVNVVNGDLTITGSGAGILVVTGLLTLNGNFSYNGLILAIGEGGILKSGGGGAIVSGAMFAANLTTGNPGTSGPGAYPATGYGTPIALGSNFPPGIPWFGWSGGGNATIQYDSCWITAVTQSLPYHLVSQRELSY